MVWGISYTYNESPLSCVLAYDSPCEPHAARATMTHSNAVGKVQPAGVHADEQGDAMIQGDAWW